MVDTHFHFLVYLKLIQEMQKNLGSSFNSGIIYVGIIYFVFIIFTWYCI